MSVGDAIEKAAAEIDKHSVLSAGQHSLISAADIIAIEIWEKTGYPMNKVQKDIVQMNLMYVLTNFLSRHTSPQWTHDCPACKYLGRYKDYDLYHCTLGGQETVLARYSNVPSEHHTWPPTLASAIPQITEAQVRARIMGLIPGKETNEQGNSVHVGAQTKS
jgi:hypothetical protein